MFTQWFALLLSLFAAPPTPAVAWHPIPVVESIHRFVPPPAVVRPIQTPRSVQPPPIASGVRTVNNHNCPASKVNSFLILTAEGTSVSFPMCYLPPDSDDVLRCITYHADGTW